MWGGSAILGLRGRTTADTFQVGVVGLLAQRSWNGGFVSGLDEGDDGGEVPARQITDELRLGQQSGAHLGLDRGSRAIEPVGERLRRDVIWRVAAFGLMLPVGHGTEVREMP